MTDRELLQQALDMLDDINQCSLPPTGIPLPAEIDHVMEALRARLAQPEPEPVATQYKYIDAHGKDYWTSEPWEGKKVEAIRYLYASPQREWVGLTKEDLETIHQDLFNMSGWSFNTMAKAIEAKLKQKNT